MKILEVRVTTDNFDNPMPHNRGFMYPSGQNDLFYKYDHVGNVIATLDYYGNLVNSIDMEAFGTVRSGGQTGIRLTTKEYHPEAELYYFNQRWYDKDSGRWVQKEPLRWDGPNLYHFNWNNPSYYFDFDGFQAAKPYGDDWIGCVGRCMENGTIKDVISPVFSAYPKRWFGARVPDPTSPNTTLLSYLHHKTKLGRGLRLIGRPISKVCTPLFIAEGVVNVATETHCMAACAGDNQAY